MRRTAAPRGRARPGPPTSGWRDVPDRALDGRPSRGSDGIAFIGAGDEPETSRQHYFDSRGVHRIYGMSLGDGVWNLWRDASDPFPQRFSGTFSDDGKTIAGRSEKAVDGSDWETDLDLTYRKVS